MFKNNLSERFISEIAPPEVGNKKIWWFVFSANKLLVTVKGEAVGIPFSGSLKEIGVDSDDKLYLGRLDGFHCYSVDAGKNAVAIEGMEYQELRPVFNLLEVDLFILASRAFTIINWHRMSKFCGRCGTGTVMKQDERAKQCPNCSNLIFPRISPAIIIAVVRNDKLLLAHSKNFRPNFYSVLAGFVEPGETIEECAKREVMEEVGINVKNLKYFGSQPWPFPDSLMLAFTAEYESGEIKADGVEIMEAGWYGKDNFPETPTSTAIAGHLISWFKENH